MRLAEAAEGPEQRHVLQDAVLDLDVVQDLCVGFPGERGDTGHGEEDGWGPFIVRMHVM